MNRKIALFIMTIFIITPVLAIADTSNEAMASAISEGTVSAEAGVSVSADEASALASAYAGSSSNVASSITEVVASGQNVASYSFSISDNTGSIAGSAGTAVGNLIALFSRSIAVGRNVYAEGSATITASQMASAGVMTQTMPLENGLYQITVQAVGSGEGDATGTVYTIAWAIEDPPASIHPVARPTAISGFVFGHSDIERYLHFKNQLATSNDTNITNRAKYWLEVLPWTEYGMTQQEFEDKYINNSYYMNFTIDQYLRLQAQEK